MDENSINNIYGYDYKLIRPVNNIKILELIKEEPIFTRVEKNPLAAYHWWFKDFEIKKERFVREPINEFFKVPSSCDYIGEL